MATFWLIGAAMLQSLLSPTSDAWEFVTEDAGGDLSIDRGSISRAGDVARVVVRVRLTGANDGEPPAILVMRMAFDCRTRTGTAEATDAYEGDGTFVGSTDAVVEAQPVVATSPAEAAFAIVCAGA